MWWVDLSRRKRHRPRFLFWGLLSVAYLMTFVAGVTQLVLMLVR